MIAPETVHRSPVAVTDKVPIAASEFMGTATTAATDAPLPRLANIIRRRAIPEELAEARSDCSVRLFNSFIILPR
ncbi:MAG: hypothetical protein CO105_13385 [Comamonadaceae bacterium CG_4_9_14_3_um_filter_60_33]|nr:MAG: hypothetical protein AUK51_03240 [Comamonadaceae bacterium CG2_30_59_20]PIY27669.1 MAG: hypothetical protein COZ09_13995 [Comamonadaceae bacterium CG_4_10_14_3_um_filter_60_42]PJB41544.1 MAG: hypothetical protein CO105_13385 [Comamonadaceae bacterium CG_4_9_14_3_um_filter_60_33]